MVLLWQSSAFCCDWGSFPNTPGSGISHVQSAQLQRTRWTITVTALIFSGFWNPNTVSAALRLRDVCDIQLQSHGNLKRTKSFTPCSSPTETSSPLPSASSFSVQRSKSDLRKYENQKRIIQYPRYLDPEIVIQSGFFVLRTDLTTNKASTNVTETESSPITILSAEKQAFAALFCKGIVRQATKQMHSLFAKNGSLHSPEQPMPVLLCGHFAFTQFRRP